MPTVTPDQMVEAINKQKLLDTNEALYARCDELAQSQQFMFMELVSFARDGATDPQITELIGFLSVMQYLAENVSSDVARPVKKTEFQEAVKRAIFWFKTFDSQDKSKMIEVWAQSMGQQGEPVIWAWLVGILRKNDFLTCDLTESIVVTLYAVADVFSRRLANAK
jgi:hypothetical protein